MHPILFDCHNQILIEVVHELARQQRKVCQRTLPAAAERMFARIPQRGHNVRQRISRERARDSLHCRQCCSLAQAARSTGNEWERKGGLKLSEQIDCARHSCCPLLIGVLAMRKRTSEHKVRLLAFFSFHLRPRPSLLMA